MGKVSKGLGRVEVFACCLHVPSTLVSHVIFPWDHVYKSRHHKASEIFGNYEGYFRAVKNA